MSIGGDFRGIVDRVLAERRLVRNVWRPATVPARLAEKHARRFGLVVLKPPLAIRDFGVSAVVHKRMADDRATRWLRRQLVAMFAGRAISADR